MKRYLIFCYFFCVCFSTASKADIDLIINGLDGRLKDNVNAYLSAIPEKEYSTGLRFRARVEHNVSEALAALGYYHPIIDFKTDPDKLAVNITPGPPMLIEQLDIQLIGEAEGDKEFTQLISSSGLKKGSVLNHADYEQLKSGLQNLALKKGYFNARFEKSRLEVMPDKNQATVILHFYSGIRYQFGETIITGSQIETDKVRSLQTYHAGDPYLVSKMGAFNQNLSNTDWFSSVVVEPDLSTLEQRRNIPVNVTLKPSSRNQIETGLGYSTDVGIQGSLKWNKPWVNDRGHSFSSRISLSKPEKLVTASYKIPLDDVLNQYYQVQYGLKKVDNLDTKSLESNLSLEQHWRLSDGWNRTVFVRYLIENYEQGILDDIGQFVLPGITFSRTRTKMPSRGSRVLTWGDKQTLTVEYGNRHVLSETDLLRIQGGTSWIRTYGGDHRFLLKFDGGINLVNDFNQISPSLRFFAGGDNSIRGYDYESISPTDSSGALTGAKYLATSSLEYQYQLAENWWAALFYDYGDAFNDTPDWKRGTGFGVRWISPVGPVRLDFAWGLDAPVGNEFKIHFTLGPDL